MERSMSVVLTLFLTLGIPISTCMGFTGQDIPYNSTQGLKEDPERIYDVFETNISLNLHNGQSDSLWDQVTGLKVPEFGVFGLLKAVYNSTSIHVLFRFNKGIRWIAIQFDSNNDGHCMGVGDDGWIFGIGVLGAGGEETKYNGDYHYEGHSLPVEDEVNDVFFEQVSPSSDGYGLIEVTRQLSTGDLEGRDVSFKKGNSYQVIFGSTANHVGSHSSMFLKISTQGLPTNVSVTDPNNIFSEENGVKNTQMFFMVVTAALLVFALQMTTIVLLDRKGWFS